MYLLRTALINLISSVAPATLIILLSGIPAPAYAATIRVDNAGSGDYLTIGEGVAAAAEGDTVFVAPGTYIGRENINIDFEGTNISLLSEAGAESTVIFCSYVNRGLRFRNREDSTSVFQGFTISRGEATNGGAVLMEGNVKPRILDCIFKLCLATEKGGGVYVSGGSPVIRRCQFIGNQSLTGFDPTGGALACISFANPRIVDCDFIENQAQVSGGGLYCALASADFVRCNIYGNWAFSGGGVFSEAGSNLTFTDCTFTSNYAYWGAGLLAQSAPVTLTGCTFSGNVAGSRGAGARFHSVHPAVVTGCTFIDNVASNNGGAMEYIYGSTGMILNSTIVRNTAGGDGSGIYCAGGEPSIANSVIAFNTHGKGIHCSAVEMPSITHCVVFANDEGDSLCGNYFENIFIDPLLCNISADDLTLCANSPCLPGNNEWSEQIGAHAQGCGDCTSPVRLNSWGRIKSIFRNID